MGEEKMDIGADMFADKDVFDFNGGNFSNKPIDASALKEKIYGMFISILVSRFPNNNVKQMIYTTSKGYQMSCPYCGDSKKDDSKKRGHVYLETNSYKCWNCNIYRPLHTLLDEFKVGNLTASERNSLSVQHIMQNSGNKKSIAEFYNEDVLFDRDIIDKAHYLKPLKQSRSGTSYMMGRSAFIGDMENFSYNDRFGNLYILNTFNDKVIGFQMRLSKPLDNGSRFISYNYEDIIKKIQKKEEYDVDFAKSMNHVSLIYNILNIDFTREVKIFESSICSLHFKNSIAMWGSNNMLYLPKGQYYLDNDIAGRTIAIKYLNKGHKVFLWTKFIKENPHFKKCKDFNDIFRRQNEPNFPKGRIVTETKLEKYLGDSVFDKNWL